MADEKNPDKEHISFEDDMMEEDLLEERLNKLAAESEDSLKPKAVSDRDSKWASLDEAEEAAGFGALEDGTNDWF